MSGWGMLEEMNEGWEKLRLLPDEEEILPSIRVFWAG